MSKYYPVQSFVPKEVYALYGAKSWQFVSDSIVKAFDFVHEFFDRYFKDLDSNVEKVTIVINNYHDAELIKILGQTFNWRGLRTVGYIVDMIAAKKPVAKMSQHIGGATNAGDFNVILHFKGGKTLVKNSGEIHDIIVKHQAEFVAAGLTTLEDKAATTGWVHGDCRHTGSVNELLIVKP